VFPFLFWLDIRRVKGKRKLWTLVENGEAAKITFKNGSDFLRDAQSKTVAARIHGFAFLVWRLKKRAKEGFKVFFAQPNAFIDNLNGNFHHLVLGGSYRQIDKDCLAIGWKLDRIGNKVD